MSHGNTGYQGLLRCSGVADTDPCRQLFLNTSATASDNAWSASFWIYTASTQAFKIFAGRFENYGVYFALASGRPYLYIKNSDGDDYLPVTPNTSAGKVNDGNWHNVTYTYDGSGLRSGFKIYIDATSQSLSAWSPTYDSDIGKGASGNSTSPLNTTVGTASGGISFTIGFHRSNGIASIYYATAIYFDEVSLWDCELAAGEVTDIYNSGDPKNLNAHAQASKLVRWYRMGDHADDVMTGGTSDTADAADSDSRIVDVSTAAGYSRYDAHAPYKSLIASQVVIATAAP
ncbi:MAG: hypothetical protein CMJ20_02510 [Phycisphaeraceae bacterium]|nr:hypothetical protein [Phycisphaeraceae bacterium]